MTLKPTPGLVIRYDFLWKEEHLSGQESGLKDRPCSIIIAKLQAESHVVLVCPITHTPPKGVETAIEMPPKVARYLGLDHDQMWVKTHQVNKIIWPENQIPYGITKTPKGEWAYGTLPYTLRQSILEQVRANSEKLTLGTVPRE